MKILIDFNEIDKSLKPFEKHQMDVAHHLGTREELIRDFQYWNVKHWRWTKKDSLFVVSCGESIELLCSVFVLNLSIFPAPGRQSRHRATPLVEEESRLKFAPVPTPDHRCQHCWDDWFLFYSYGKQIVWWRKNTTLNCIIQQLWVVEASRRMCCR